MKVAIYLRKSRADEEAERRGELETLSRHRTALLKTAKQMKLNIINIYEEIVSGESIEHRPKMVELLQEVENNSYDAVLVMDIDRLGRGNMSDQGLILETFKRTKTKIITPRKTYDLNDEWDEEYSEFEAFMARKELKIITRRMQSGRIRSVEEGNYLGTSPPYGYDIEYRDNNRTRTLIPNQYADVIRIVFDLYANKGLGANKIANELNELGYKTQTNKNWYGSAILNIIKNKVYAGYVQWKKVERKKSKEIDKITVSKMRDKEDWIEAKGKHQSIISEELYNKAQEKLNGKYHVPYHTNVTNPLAGIIKCGNCGASMIYRPYTGQKAHLMCYAHCGNKSSRFEYVENELLDTLNDWLIEYKTSWDNIDKDTVNNSNKDTFKRLIQQLQNELNNLEKQKDNLHDFLERGIYDVDTYLERSKSIGERIEKTTNSIIKAEQDLLLEDKKEQAKKDIIPRVERVLEIYPLTDDIKTKNDMLKSILEYVLYKKEKHQKNNDFSLLLYPKVLT